MKFVDGCVSVGRQSLFKFVRRTSEPNIEILSGVVASSTAINCFIPFLTKVNETNSNESQNYKNRREIAADKN